MARINVSIQVSESFPVLVLQDYMLKRHIVNEEWTKEQLLEHAGRISLLNLSDIRALKKEIDRALTALEAAYPPHKK